MSTQELFGGILWIERASSSSPLIVSPLWNGGEEGFGFGGGDIVL